MARKWINEKKSFQDPFSGPLGLLLPLSSWGLFSFDFHFSPGMIPIQGGSFQNSSSRGFRGSRGFHFEKRTTPFPKSGKKAAHKLKKNPRNTGRVFPGHPAGQTGVYWPVSQKFPVVYSKKNNCRDTGRVSQKHPALQWEWGFRNFMCFIFCAFSAPYNQGRKNSINMNFWVRISRGHS